MAVCNDFVAMLQTMFNNLTNSSNPPAIVSLTLRRVRGGQRRCLQCGVTETPIRPASPRAGRSSCPPATRARAAAISAARPSPTASASMGWAPPSTTWPWAAPISAIHSPARIIPIGTPTTPRPSARRSRTFPEIPWNTTCGSQLFATYEGYATTYGASGFCNSSFVANTADGFYLENWAGSGGQSLCAQGTPSVSGVISGTCTGWPKPSWQSGLLGNPADTVRDLPDVSMFASFGPWYHAYAICYSDTMQRRHAVRRHCQWLEHGWGGTSFGSPIWAGIQALVNQYTGSTQGNPNPVLYQARRRRVRRERQQRLQFQQRQRRLRVPAFSTT